MIRFLLLSTLLIVATPMLALDGLAAPVPTELSEFIFESAAFQSCHASTLVQLEDGTVVASWFGGKEEGDNTVEIWVSRKEPGRTWSPPVKVTDYPQSPSWNPVLFSLDERTLRLFFRVGPSPQTWVSAFIDSTDGGRSWSEPEYLPAGLLGPIKNKPILLSDGTLLSGTSVEAGRDRSHRGLKPYWSWSVWVERSTDLGNTWSVHGPVTFPGVNFGVIQPSLWEADDGSVRMVMRATQQIGTVAFSKSTDKGMSWSPAKQTSLPNPNSGLDAVKLKDRRVALVYNHTSRGRTPLNIAFSGDDGETWGHAYTLETEPGEYSYPSVIEGSDNKVHLTYTWKRQRIKYVVLDPAEVKTNP